MTKKEVKAMLAKHEAWHAAWLGGPDKGQRINLDGVDMRGISMQGANLQAAILEWVRLDNANMSGSNMLGAYIEMSWLKGTNLSGSDLSYVSLRASAVEDADLRNTNLKGVNWTSARLRNTNLKGAFNLVPTAMLLADWGEVPKKLCQDLMAYNASCHPDPKRFNKWAAGGQCPYWGTRVQCCANFVSHKKYWSPELLKNPVRPYDLLCRLLKAKHCSF